jgi:hypothetical protein
MASLIDKMDLSELYFSRMGLKLLKLLKKEEYGKGEKKGE